MNELLFFLQVSLIFSFALWALKLGKEALTAWVAIQALIANLFVLIQITLFGFDVTSSDAFMIGSLLGLNFLQEYYSREEAQKATWICFFFMFFFALISQVHLRFSPSIHDFSQPAFETLLKPSLRLLIASLSVFFLVQQIDIRLFAWLKTRFPTTRFAYRTVATLIITQFLDTVLFSFAGLYGIVASVIDVIVLSFAVKLLTITFCSALLRWAKP